jgi:hypothetical protein
VSIRAQVRRQEIREAKRRFERLEREQRAAMHKPEPPASYRDLALSQALAYVRNTGLVYSSASFIIWGGYRWEPDCVFPAAFVNEGAAWLG